MSHFYFLFLSLGFSLINVSYLMFTCSKHLNKSVTSKQPHSDEEMSLPDSKKTTRFKINGEKKHLICFFVFFTLIAIHQED